MRTNLIGMPSMLLPQLRAVQQQAGHKGLALKRGGSGIRGCSACWAVHVLWFSWIPLADDQDLLTVFHCHGLVRAMRFPTKRA